MSATRALRARPVLRDERTSLQVRGRNAADSRSHAAKRRPSSYARGDDDEACPDMEFSPRGCGGLGGGARSVRRSAQLRHLRVYLLVYYLELALTEC
jgi:hypothetical protein